MANTVTWVVLGDGTYVKILVNNGSGTGLMPLRTGDFEHTSKLTYEMVTSHRQAAQKHGYYELLSGFLTQQQKENVYQRLVLAAPAEVIRELRKALPDEINTLISVELAEDLLAKPDKQIEQIVSSLDGVYPHDGVGPQ
jgi:hypothetical protein